MDATTESGYARKRGRTRRRLLRAGMQVMARRGVAAATVGDIAAEAGVVPGTFYNHFPSRDHLLEALVGTAICSLQRRAELIMGVTGDPAERVVLAVTALVDEAGADEVFGTFLLDLAGRSLDVRRALRDVTGAYLGHGNPVVVDAVVGIGLAALRSRLDGHTGATDTAATADIVRRLVAGAASGHGHSHRHSHSHGTGTAVAPRAAG